MNQNRLGSGLAGLVVLLAASAPAAAGPMVFSNRSAFEAATYGRQTVDFEGIAAPGDLVLFASSLTRQGVTFTGGVPGDSYLFVIDPQIFPEAYDWGSGTTLVGPMATDGGAWIDMVLPSGVTAFAVDLMTLPSGVPLLVRLGDGSQFNVPTLEFPNRAFFGIVADTPIGAVRVLVDGGAPVLDNVTIGHAAPLPPSLLSLGIGIGTLALTRLRASRRSAATLTA